jgi:outer membrane protein assembly factor BamB
MKVKDFAARALGVLLSTVATAGCLDTQNRRPAEAPRSSRTEASAASLGRADQPQPADEKRLGAFGLELFWPMKLTDETISKLQLEADPVTGVGSLYAFTESNRLYQIDVVSGKVNWVFDVGRPLSFMEHDRPISEFVYPVDPTFKRYDEVYFIAKDTLYALDKKEGSELWRRELKFTPASPPQATMTHVLVGAWDQRVYAFLKSDPTEKDWMYRTDGDIVARPAQDVPAQAFVASMDGKLYTFNVSSGEPTAVFRTEKALSADPLVYRKLVYFGSEDFNLYVLSALDGRQEYRYPTGAKITKAPIAIANPTQKGATTDTIYVKTDGPDGGIIAIYRGGKVPGTSKTSHEFLWKRDGATQVIARGRDTVFLLEPAGAEDAARTKRLVKLDFKSAYLRDEVKLTGVDYYITNPVAPEKKALLGGLVFLGYRNGWILAYKEKSPYPTE